jgi:RHS repeat-associated protein
MFAGPMKRIAYTYRTTNNPDGSAAVYGQISSENYYDGTNIGAAVTTLTVNGSARTETRGDGAHPTRTFTYTGNKSTSETDFRGVSASKTYDSNSYVNSVTDLNGHTANFTLNALTGAVLTTTFPSTPGDTPPGTPRGVVTTTYGWAACPDPNNRDANNPYFVYSTTDEAGHTTIYTRDTNKRVIRVDYPDGGYETFTYNSFGEVLTHVLKTGGTESFTYDASGNKQTYRDPYHATGNPTAWYSFDSSSRLSGVTDALGSTAGDVNHTTSYGYNARGQLTSTTFPVDPIDGQRHTITNVYYSDGTVQSTSDQLGHTTFFLYDDYKRLLIKITPQRFTGDTTPRTAYAYYDANGTGNDYTHTDANVTHASSPGGEKITTTYDENLRKASVTVADGTSDSAKISFGYDNAGNLASVISPKEQPGQAFAGQSTTTSYDERNRPFSVTDPLGNPTSCTYDAAGRKASATRANGQTTTFDSFDAMNRLLQQTVKQTPDPDAVTKYTYYTSGALHTMQDPRLVANNSSYNYNYAYDSMGRKTSLTYPPDSGNVQRSESWHYDTAGRVDTFTNRAGNVQTTVYDALNRPTSVSWNDAGLTPTVTYGYDIASRTTSITNANAIIARTYFNDNLLNTETTTYADNVARTVTYSFNADANRATLQYPNGAYSFNYTYTGRNQLKTVVNNSGGATVITYGYDVDGNLTTRTPDNSTSSTYTYDALDRVTHIGHVLYGNTRTLDYAYDSVSNRKWAKRDGGTGDVFGYDLNDQSVSVLLNVASPDTTSPGSQTINYDANGNRTTFSPYGSTDTYTTNNLNQYTQRNSSTATYDTKSNLTVGFDGSTYTYDAQNRILSASKGGTSETFRYDGLNRQVSRTIGAGQPVYNVYDGWDLIAESAPGSTLPTIAYLGGVKNLTSNLYYYQDGSGSASHLSDNTGHLLEWYRYDLQGTPIFYNASNTQISASAYGIRHLFTGQQWYSELGLYDLRNRFYSPDVGRFLQADPIGFGGDATNLYRYCANNPLKLSDPTGELGFPTYSSTGLVINVPVTYNYGPGVPANIGNYFNTVINSCWSGNYAGLNVTVNFYNGTYEGYTNNIGLSMNVGTSYADNWNLGGRDAAVYTVEALVTHEGGHLIGVPDMVLNPDSLGYPWDPTDIMNADPATQDRSPTARDLVWAQYNNFMTMHGPNAGVPFGVGPGTFQMGTFIPGGIQGLLYGSSYGSMGYSLIGVPGTFVTTDSGQTYSTAVGFSLHPSDNDPQGSIGGAGFSAAGAFSLDAPRPGNAMLIKAEKHGG